MTTSKAHEVERREGARRPRTLAGALAARMYARATALGSGVSETTWPSARYQADPVAFAREVLGATPWVRQVEIIEAVRDHMRVAVRSGHKIGKSNLAAIVALWFFCSFEDARVVMSSVTSRQVDQILWRELRMMHARSAKPIGGEIHEMARSGLKAADFREVVGFTAREAEAVAGVSGKNLLYILDEASGIPEAIYEAIEGNRAGGARTLLLGNPTRTEGEHFEAFHGKSDFYQRFTVSSEESPNVVAGRVVIPGLATREWIEEKKREWGVESALYKVRVKGEHVLREDGKIISVAMISAAETRWHDTKAEGRLMIGIDPAGPGEGGDETAMAVRRGQKILEVYGRHGLTEDGMVAHAMGLMLRHGQPREVPVVIIDREGPIGRDAWDAFRRAADASKGQFDVYGIRASDKAIRRPLEYDRMRDELLANLAAWLREGGAIPEDTKLAKELHAPEWAKQVQGRLKVTPKDELRAKLGRSPDRLDAVALSVWEPLEVRQEAESPAADASPPVEPERQLDPYAGQDAWR